MTSSTPTPVRSRPRLSPAPRPATKPSPAFLHAVLRLRDDLLEQACELDRRRLSDAADVASVTAARLTELLEHQNSRLPAIPAAGDPCEPG